VELCDIGIPMPAYALGMHHIDDLVQTDARHGNPQEDFRMSLTAMRVQVTVWLQQLNKVSQHISSAGPAGRGICSSSLMNRYLV
jgi:hypothetical protein